MSRPQAKYWIFTENNPKGALDGLFESEYDNGNLEWAAWQLEVGENGTEHFQGTLCFRKKKLLSTVKKLIPSAHWDICRSVQASINYCLKPDGTKDTSFRLDGPWTIGDPKYKENNAKCWNHIAQLIKEDNVSDYDLYEKHGYVSQLAMYSRGIDRIRSIIQSKNPKPWRQLEVYYFYGDTEMHKSKTARQMFPLIYKKEPGDALFNGYEDEDALLLDDFYGREFSYNHLLNVLDGHHLQLRVLYGTRIAKYTKVVITCNVLPHLWYPNLFSSGKVNPNALFRRIHHLYHFTEPGIYTEIPDCKDYFRQKMKEARLDGKEEETQRDMRRLDSMYNHDN